MHFQKYHLLLLADDNFNVTQVMQVSFERAENIVVKRRKCWLRAFSLLAMPSHYCLTFPKRQIFYSSKLNENRSIFEEHDLRKKVLKTGRIENTVGKGEIAKEIIVPNIQNIRKLR